MLTRKKLRRKARKKRKANPKQIEAMAKARDESFRRAPKMPNGAPVPGYKYKKLIDANKTMEVYRENNLEPEQGTRYTSRPLFVKEPKVLRQLVKLIRDYNCHYTTACRKVGISRSTFMRWMEYGAAGVNKEYTDFYRKICKAEADGELKVLKSLKKHEKFDWRAGAWQLERRWPEHWARRDPAVAASMKLSGEINVTHKHELSQQVVKDPAVLELARKIIDGSEFGFHEVEEVNDPDTNKQS